MLIYSMIYSHRKFEMLEQHEHNKGLSKSNYNRCKPCPVHQNVQKKLIYKIIVVRSDFPCIGCQCFSWSQNSWWISVIINYMYSWESARMQILTKIFNLPICCLQFSFQFMCFISLYVCVSECFCVHVCVHGLVKKEVQELYAS